MGRDWTAPTDVDRYQPSDEEPARSNSAGNKRRWCKGRIGIPHAFLWENDPSWTWHRLEGCTRQIKICFGCGRRSYHWRYICHACGGRRKNFWQWDRDAAIYTCICRDRPAPRGRPWRPQGQEGS